MNINQLGFNCICKLDLPKTLRRLNQNAEVFSSKRRSVFKICGGVFKIRDGVFLFCDDISSPRGSEVIFQIIYENSLHKCHRCINH